MSYAIPMSIDFPNMTRDDFADSFESMRDFIFYVRSEPTYRQSHNILSLYMGQDDNTVIIEEQPTNGWEMFFDATRTIYTIDRSWRYIAMDWFDHICGTVLEM